MSIFAQITLLLLFSYTAFANKCTDLFAPFSKSEIYKEAAIEAGLLYLEDFPEGITRKINHKQKDVKYYLSGKEIKSQRTINRLNALGVPLGVKDVWFSPFEKSHIQAIGSDSVDHKQYYYHPLWSGVKDSLKYGRLITFANSLPIIRNHIKSELKANQLTKTKALAAIIRTLDRTAIRIGSEEYADKYGHYGLTTLTKRHFIYKSGNYYLKFKGKTGKLHEILIDDKNIISVLQEGLKLSGTTRLFCYFDQESNKTKALDANDVNQYLFEITNTHITAKDFRTWVGTVAAVEYLYKAMDSKENIDFETAISEASKLAADRLRNTQGIARESYIHPIVFDAFKDRKVFNHAIQIAKHNLANQSTGRNLFEEITFILIQ